MTDISKEHLAWRQAWAVNLSHVRVGYISEHLVEIALAGMAAEHEVARLQGFLSALCAVEPAINRNRRKLVPDEIETLEKKLAALLAEGAEGK